MEGGVSTVWWGCGFSVLRSHCGRKARYRSAVAVLLKKPHGKRQRQLSRSPALIWQAAPQRECQPTPEAMQLQQDIQDLSTHFTAIIHEKTGIRQHLTLTSVLHDIYKNPLNCEEQSCLLFHKIISIRPCCWLRSLWKSVKVGHYKKKRQV